MTLAFYGSTFTDNCIPYVQRLFSKLEREGVPFFIYEDFARFLLPKIELEQEHPTFRSHQDIKGKVDTLVSIGGDGTMLKSIVHVRDSGIPVMGLNTGRLGFLSNVSKEAADAAMEALLKGKYELDQRSLVTLDPSQPIFGDSNFALNELSVHKKDTSAMVTVHAYINDDFLNTYWADGLIVATPTGSTAYSLSCGGPIVSPNADNFIITPIAPHNMNVRPVIVRDDNVITLKIEGRDENFLAALDSRSVTIDPTMELRLKKADFKVNLVRLEGQNFLDTIRTKLMWGMDRRN